MVGDGTTAAGQAVRAPGRPRSAAADRAILSAALRLLVREGYAGLSLEAVAAAAGVGKTTIYRRYRDKRELAAAAVSAMVDELGPPPGSGDTRADLIALLGRMHRAITAGPLFPIAGTLLVEERRNPELLERFRERVIGPNRARVRAVLEGGVRRAQVRPDVDLEVALDALAGAVFARHLSGLDTPPDWVESVVDVVWRGLAMPVPREPAGDAAGSGPHPRPLSQ